MRRVLKVAKWFLILLVVLVLCFFLTIMPWAVSTITTTNRFHFSDPNNGKTPSNFGMQYESAEFHSTDGIDLKGWWIPAATEGSSPAAGTIVYVHGQNRSRVEMLPMADYGHSLGYDGLAFDVRHHGASSGKVSSAGYWERLDVEAAVRYALHRNAARPLILWGVSLGAAASLMAAAETPDVAAVLSDSSFLSFEDTAQHHWKLYFPTFPKFPMYNETIWLITERAHFKPSDFDLRNAVDRINPRPILFIGVEGDRRMPPTVARQLDARSSSPDKMLVIVPGTKHGEGFTSGNARYKEAVKEFLAKMKAGH